MTRDEMDAAIIAALKELVDDVFTVNRYDRAIFRAGLLAAAEVLEAFDVYDSTVAACAKAIRAAAEEVK